MLSPSLVFLGLFFCIFRLYLIIPAATAGQQRKRKGADTCSLAVFLGSGKSDVTLPNKITMLY